jgi:hypothetical protein
MRQCSGSPTYVAPSGGGACGLESEEKKKAPPVCVSLLFLIKLRTRGLPGGRDLDLDLDRFFLLRPPRPPSVAFLLSLRHRLRLLLLLLPRLLRPLLPPRRGRRLRRGRRSLRRRHADRRAGVGLQAELLDVRAAREEPAAAQLLEDEALRRRRDARALG